MCVLLYLFKTRVLLECCIFQPAIGCCALQTLVEIVIFSVFYKTTIVIITVLSLLQVEKWPLNFTIPTLNLL